MVKCIHQSYCSEVLLMKYGIPRQQLMILFHIIKDTTLHLKKYHETGQHVDSSLSTQLSLSKRLAFTDERVQGFLVGYDSFFSIGI